MPRRPAKRLRRSRIREIVGWCSLIARRKLDADTTNSAIAHIVANLPSATLHAVLAGDAGEAMLQAMRLTLPFLGRRGAVQ